MDTDPKLVRRVKDFFTLPESERFQYIRALLNPKKFSDSQIPNDKWRAYTLKDAYQMREPRKYVVSGLFERPSLNIVYGSPGTFKSFLIADLAMCVCTGNIWLPIAPWEENGQGFPTTTCPVMWIDFDNGRFRTHERFAALGRARNLSEDSSITYFSMPTPPLNAADSGKINRLIKRANSLDVGLICVDNLGFVSGSKEENSSAMIEIMSNFRYLAEETGAAVILIHHQRKGSGHNGRLGDSLRGHSSIEAALDLALLVRREGNSNCISLEATKVRGEQISPFNAEFTHKASNDNQLYTAKFFRINNKISKDIRELKSAIINLLTSDIELNKSNLKTKVRESLPNFSIRKITDSIESFANEGIILEKRGKVNNEIIFSLPKDD